MTTSSIDRHIQNSIKGVLAVSLSLCWFSSPGAEELVLEEVIITAQKREQPLQDVPVAVSVFSGDTLRQSGIKDFFDLQVNAPGLVVDANQSATTSNFSIRGVGTSSQNFGLESSVGLYVDGVYHSRQSSMINDLVDIDWIEILRGPQGTLFGRNTPAGAIFPALPVTPIETTLRCWRETNPIVICQTRFGKNWKVCYPRPRGSVLEEWANP